MMFTSSRKRQQPELVVGKLSAGAYHDSQERLASTLTPLTTFGRSDITKLKLVDSLERQTFYSPRLTERAQGSPRHALYDKSVELADDSERRVFHDLYSYSRIYSNIQQVAVQNVYRYRYSNHFPINQVSISA